MTKQALAALATGFATWPDPCVKRTKRYMLLDMVAIAICVLICGAEGWTEVEDFGKARWK